MLIRQPTRADAELLASRLREADRAELIADGSPDFFKTIDDGVWASVLSCSVFFDGELACIFGLVPYQRQVFGDIGVPWLLGTDLVAKHARQMRRVSVAYLKQMLHLYPVLVNHVHTKNTLAIRALRHMKFSIEPAVPYGVNGEPFHRFELRRV